MEKHSPHCKLSIVKKLIEQGKVEMTASAVSGGKLLGFDRRAIIDVVMALEAKDFYKSMTTYANHAIWQDVYRPRTDVGDVYLKLTVVNEVLIVSFKEL